MKILVLCPGSWTHGLNSPERGEGRWAQNYAKLLAQYGHEVYAASGNNSKIDSEHNVKLISESQARSYEPYDVYIDSCWWDRKVAIAKSKIYVRLHWSLEERVGKIKLPANEYLAYPYPDSTQYFIHDQNVNVEKTFCLPTAFGDEFGNSKFHNQNLFIPCRGVEDFTDESIQELFLTFD
jgi:hypothetical protein